MGYIYLITNKINEKKYVGKTTQSIEERWYEHIHDAKRPRYEIRPLYRAINKYGIDNFNISKLEKCSNSILEEREQYWIKKLDTYHNGYNATMGGDGKILLDYDVIVKEYLLTHNMSQVSRTLKCDKETVKKALLEKNIPIRTSQEVSKEIHSKKIGQFDKNGNLIEIFSSYKEAEEKMGNTQRHICDVANGKRKSAYGYVWKWIE